MKTLMKRSACMAIVAALLAGVSLSAYGDDRADIEAVISNYQTALNASDVDALLALYTDDGVFMAEHRLPSVGKDAIATTYAAIFDAITLGMDFTIDEIVLTGPNWAFARTLSDGPVTLLASGVTTPGAYQELFVFTKTDDGSWKIARYIFATTNP